MGKALGACQYDRFFAGRKSIANGRKLTVCVVADRVRSM